MADYTVCQALHEFFAGESLAQHLIHGIPVIWIGRIGKLLQFFAAWAVIAEIIGIDELRSVLRDVRDSLAPVRLRHALSRIWLWQRLLLTTLYSCEPSRSQAARQLKDFEDHPSVIVNGAIAITSAIAGAIYVPVDQLWLRVVIGIGLLWFIGFHVSPMLVFLCTALVGLILCLAAYFSIAPTVWLLNLSSPEKRIKWLALGLVAIGFFMDFAAS